MGVSAEAPSIGGRRVVAATLGGGAATRAVEPAARCPPIMPGFRFLFVLACASLMESTLCRFNDGIWGGFLSGPPLPLQRESKTGGGKHGWKEISYDQTDRFFQRPN